MKLYQTDLFGGETRVLPSAPGSLTSAAAARSMTDSVDNARQLVLSLIFRIGPLTDEEIALHLGMNPNTARPRRIELERMGLIIKCGTKRTRSGREANKYLARTEREEEVKKASASGARRSQKDHA